MNHKRLALTERDEALLAAVVDEIVGAVEAAV